MRCGDHTHKTQIILIIFFEIGVLIFMHNLFVNNFMLCFSTAVRTAGTWTSAVAAGVLTLFSFGTKYIFVRYGGALMVGSPAVSFKSFIYIRKVCVGAYLNVI